MGALLLCLGFGLGLEAPSVTVENRPFDCERAIPVSWLMGSPDVEWSSARTTAQERHAEVACEAPQERRQLVAWALLGLGLVVAVTGWTALGERETPSSARSPAH